eukprot:m.53953 g.53953  ORF g.53953 m.53953 type:complete len:251 (+) comp6810_c0_seq1:72-824(+)
MQHLLVLGVLLRPARRALSSAVCRSFASAATRRPQQLNCHRQPPPQRSLLRRRFLFTAPQSLCTARPQPGVVPEKPAQPPKAAAQSPLRDAAASGILATGAISALTLPVHFELVPPAPFLLIGSFGATACLLFAAPAGPVSQPRPVVGGHVLSATVGTSLHQLAVVGAGVSEMLVAPAAVGLSVAGMMATRCMHPPAAGTALIALTASGFVAELGWLFPVMPVATGSAALVALAVVLNRAAGRSYPSSWL